LAPTLKRNNLLRNKHIPAEYLRASIHQRLALLQGLMDTDGGTESGSAVSFSNANRQISEGVYELVVSLGMKATLSTKATTHHDAHVVRFTPTLPVFRFERKLKRIRFYASQSLRRYHRMIQNIEHID